MQKFITDKGEMLIELYSNDQRDRDHFEVVGVICDNIEMDLEEAGRFRVRASGKLLCAS